VGVRNRRASGRDQLQPGHWCGLELAQVVAGLCWSGLAAAIRSRGAPTEITIRMITINGA